VGDLGVGLFQVREQTESETREYRLLTLPFGVEWDKRDSETNTKSGYYLDLDLTPFVGLQGIGNGTRVFADTRGYASVGPDQKVTLAGRSMIGSLIGVEPEDAPADFLFFSGGGDFGYVGDTSTPLREGDWHAGTGLGVRYQTGIGPIRLDVGTPATGDKQAF